MSAVANPFTPTFGITPPFFAGREQIILEMDRAFERGIGDPSLCSLFIGPRGSGKTALLTRVGESAHQAGWITVNVMAENGMLEEVLQHVEHASAHLLASKTRRHLTGLSIGSAVGISWEDDNAREQTWRMQMEEMLDELSESNTGVLITVDEIDVEVEELVKLAMSYQLLVREGRKVALAMAGLPAHVSALISDKRVSFLRRARQRHLEPLSDHDVRSTLRMTSGFAGREIDEDALDDAVAAISGFPFMLQLVGFEAWEAAADSPTISKLAMAKGIERAKAEFTRGVLEHTWEELSENDRAFVRAMIPEDGPSKLSEIAQRMGKSSGYASTYKARLVRQGVIGPRAGKRFDFDLPMMREFVEGRDD